jgi:ATP-binding cassette, subfamily C, bacterial CydD
MRPSSTTRVLRWPGAERLVLRNVGLAVVSTALVIVQWWLLAQIVTDVVEGRSTPTDQLLRLAGLLAAWLARSGLAALGSRRNAATSSTVRASVRLALVDQLLRRGPAGLDQERSGELVNTATEAVARLDALLARYLPSAVTAAVVAPLLAITVLVLDPLSGAVLLVTGPLLVVLLWLVGTHADAAARERWETLGRLGALLVDTLRGLPTLVTYGRATRAVGWLARTSEAYRETTMRVLRKAFLSGFVLELGASLATALVAVSVGIRLFEGHLDLGLALFVLLLVPEFFAPLRTLGADHHARLEAAPAADRLFALLDESAPVRGARTVPAGVPHLELRGVHVTRDGRDVLSGVDLDLPPGSRTALVGPSGAGKTTLAGVLLGLRTPTAGEVLVNGVPLADYDADAWRATISYVPERPWLSPGTVADNVRLGRPDATDAEVQSALAGAQAWEWVLDLPAGLDTALGEDAARLSGGERLRIALARAFVADASVVVLDEPTSQLDRATESAVLAALDELAVGRTVLVITHRAAPLAYVDRVVELRDGAVAAGVR